MSSEIIKEFLVSLGFKMDESALKKFDTGITQATKAVVGLAAAVEGTAVLVAAAVARFASNLESLYFAAQRTGSSANQLKLLDRAAQDIGFSAGEAMGSIEAMNQAIRQNMPGVVGILKSLGVQIKYNKDGSVDTADAWIKAARAIKSRYGAADQQYMAYQYGGLLGISPDVMTKLLSGDIESAITRVSRAMGSADWGKMSEDSHRFMNNLRDTITIFESIGARVADNFLKKFGFKDLEDFNVWMESHSDEIVQKIDRIIDKILSFKDQVEKAIRAVVAEFNKLNDASGGWLGNILIVAALLKVTGVGSLIGGVLQLGTALATMAVGASAAAIPLASIAAALAAIYQAYKAITTGSSDISNWLDSKNAHGGSMGGDIYDWLHSPHPFAKSRGLRNNNPGNLRYAGQAGAGEDNEGYATFKDAQTGLYQLGRQIELFANRGNTTIAGIIAKYAPDGVDGNNTAAYIADVAKRMGMNPNAQMNLGDPAMLSKIMSAMIWHENGSAGYAPTDISSAAGRAVQLNATTHIHVNGVGDTDAVTNRVTAAQQRVNQDLVRSFAPTVQ